MNFCLRASLLPVVIYGARTAANYAKVSPEIQFIVASNIVVVNHRIIQVIGKTNLLVYLWMHRQRNSVVSYLTSVLHLYFFLDESFSYSEAIPEGFEKNEV